MEIVKTNAVAISFVIILLLSQDVFAQKPDYSLNIDLKNKSVELGESMLFVIHLRGGGICNQAYLKIDTEGIMIFPEKRPIIVNRINQTEPKPIDLETEFTESCIIGEKSVSYAVNETHEIGSLGLDLTGEFFKFQFNDIEARGILKPLDKTQPGEYDIEATFFCLNKYQWFHFKDTQSFKVFLKGEREQFEKSFKFAFYALLISSLTLLVSFLYFSAEFWMRLTLNTRTRITNIFRRTWYKAKQIFKK